VSQVSLLFKERILSVLHLKQEGNFVIGHTPDSQIHIDSLAVLPQHAQISYKEPNYIIKPLNDKAKILINGKLIKFEEQEEQILSNDDNIGIGKHTLHFLFDEIESEEKEEVEKVIAPIIIPHNGWVQYLSGKNMGTVIHITPEKSEVSDPKKDNVINITAQSGGYYVSLIKGDATLKTSKTAIGQEPTRLEDDDAILLGSQEVLFYLS